MGRYEYKALGHGGEVLSGAIDSDTREGAIGALRRQGVVPLQVREGRHAPRPLLSALPALGSRKPTERDLMLFTREFSIMLEAGLPIDRALATLDRMIATGPLKGLAGELAGAVRAGSALAPALERRPEIFPAYYVGMVRAGEAGSALVDVLQRLGHMLERREALKASVRSALAYPLLVLALTGLTFVVLMVYVVPEFKPMFEESGMEIPLSTRVLLAASDLVVNWGWVLLAALLTAYLGLRILGQRGMRSERLDAALLGLPVFGDILRKVETARLCRSLGTLRANGVALVEAVTIAAGTLSNRAMAAAARSVAGPLSRGEGLAGPLARTGRFPGLALELIEVGEESGKLQSMLLQVADIYDLEVERAVQKALALLSPIVTVMLGGLIALILGSILSAILGSYDVAM